MLHFVAQNDLRLKDQECTQLEKLLESERKKTNSLIQQIDELKTSNTDLSMQVSDSRRRLVSLDLINEECNQLRKNLTAVTIESESKKAECMTLTSHITILENSLKSLRDSNEKQNSLETSLEKVSHELRKKQDDYKKLQQTHDSVKKEHLETIETLEEKLKDVEKKTELQALKHEEILLELESIRARRERLLPLCPNCSQTYSMYQSNQAPNHSQNNSPKGQYVPYVHASGQLLSIAIPQQPILSPMMSPMQAHLPQFQVIHLAGKQSVTVECQTSPLTHCRENAEQQALDKCRREIERQKISRHVQTYDFDSFKYMESRAVNTDKIEVQVKSSQTVQIAEVKVASRNQAINVNMFDEMKRNSSAQTAPVMPRVCDEKSVQCEEKDWPKQKCYLYLSKYSYDPIKNSPNQNPALELTLKAGDYLFVLSDKEDEGYFSGELLNGRRGLAPSNFVERVKFDSVSFFNALESLPKGAAFKCKLNTYTVLLYEKLFLLVFFFHSLCTKQKTTNNTSKNTFFQIYGVNVIHVFYGVNAHENNHIIVFGYDTTTKYHKISLKLRGKGKIGEIDESLYAKVKHSKGTFQSYPHMETITIKESDFLANSTDLDHEENCESDFKEIGVAICKLTNIKPNSLPREREINEKKSVHLPFSYTYLLTWRSAFDFFVKYNHVKFLKITKHSFILRYFLGFAECASLLQF
ncbi:peripheral-type benzodiazepine receptor-associated 1-like [Brachionus plicatilis]|uniref:Peripheral-type benzodiazepine receptor-associated 1-like n=1 Tax=Brachionus plicatilis TaxID=10195 RepID=A0A3M7QM65_BRAPC|nr:peripheral-type benzodiazepine receptor-associated 1-like [Brachionus plicatilis]